MILLVKIGRVDREISADTDTHPRTHTHTHTRAHTHTHTHPYGHFLKIVYFDSKFAIEHS